MEEVRISSFDTYLGEMRKSLLEKMFFINRIFEPIDTVLDFGCANGELIKALRLFYDEYRYVGYDLSRDMIAAARKNVPEAEFYHRWEDIRIPWDRSVVNLSSVIHEVYAYCDPEGVEAFWDRIFESGFRYIAIRDMMISRQDRRQADPALVRAVRENGEFRDHLRDFEAVWGGIHRQDRLIHYLLKYRYSLNWSREVLENYLPLPLEDLLALVPETYEVRLLDHSPFPYVQYRVEQDFVFRLETPTHLKLILRRRD